MLCCNSSVSSLYNGRQFWCSSSLLCHSFSLLLLDAKVRWRSPSVYPRYVASLLFVCLLATVSFAFLWTLGTTAASFLFHMCTLSACHGLRYRQCPHCLLLNLITKQTHCELWEEWSRWEGAECSAVQCKWGRGDRWSKWCVCVWASVGAKCSPLTPWQRRGNKSCSMHKLQIARLTFWVASKKLQNYKKLFQGRLISVEPCCCH